MRLFLALFVLPLLVGAPAMAKKSQDIITVAHAYAYATSATQKNGVVLMVIENNTGAADKVTSAEGDVSERVELHTHTMEDGVMKMRQVEGYELPAGAQTALDPMGHHIMLMSLNAPLKDGEHFPLTLNFEHHAPISVDVAIIPAGTKP